MELGRLDYLVSRLYRFELTRQEKRFIELLRNYFKEKRELTVEQEVILQGLYNEKVRWAKIGLIREEKQREAWLKVRPPRIRYERN